MPEPRPKGQYTGLPFDKRVKLLGDGGKRIAPPDTTPIAPPQAPAASTPAAAPVGPPEGLKRGHPHHGCRGKKGQGIWQQPSGLPRLECSAPDCGEWWHQHPGGRWERGG